MRERPILFSPWSVQRILANQKTQTRRVIQPPPRETDFVAITGDTILLRRCPFGDRGDVLWVKEPFSLGKAQDGRTPAEAWEHVKERKQGLTVLYRAGGWKSVAPFEREEPVYPDNEPMPGWAGRRRHGMFMPRWASRITLEIADIKVERVQEISEEDAKEEGVRYWPSYHGWAVRDPDGENGEGVYRTAILSFACLWDSINGKDHPWSSNPWAWAISFRRLETQ